MDGLDNMGILQKVPGKIRTPLLRSDLPDGQTLWIKNEAAQPSGSFKIRGPSAFLDRNPVPTGVVTTASTGNHAIGLSMAARAKGHVAQIMVPVSTPKAKLDAIGRAGGQVTLVEGDYEAALARAEAFARDSGAVLVPSYDHADVIAGNQGVFEEIKQDIAGAAMPVFAPIGGGGILSGAIQAYAGLPNPVFGVELRPYQRVRQIVWEGAEAIAPFDSPPAPSTEGVAIRTLGAIPARIIHDARGLELISVTVDELRAACRWLWRTHGIRAELGGCTALAGALQVLRSGRIGGQLACVISGGNVAPEVHAEVVGAQG